MTFRPSRCLTPVLAAALTLASIAGSVAQEKKPSEPVAAVTIEVYQDKGDDYRFRIKSGDTILAISGKGYDKKADCMKVIESIRKDIGKAKIVELPKDKK